MTNDYKWIFPAGGVQVLGIDDSGAVAVKVVLDLGFGFYRTLKAQLAMVRINESPDHRTIAKDFIQEWSVARQAQGVLRCETQRLIASNDWVAHLYSGKKRESVAAALVEQGLGRI